MSEHERGIEAAYVAAYGEGPENPPQDQPLIERAVAAYLRERTDLVEKEAVMRAADELDRSEGVNNAKWITNKVLVRADEFGGSRVS
jgi:hypothetical protein